jgi:hypothetical protein
MARLIGGLKSNEMGHMCRCAIISLVLFSLLLNGCAQHQPVEHASIPETPQEPTQDEVNDAVRRYSTTTWSDRLNTAKQAATATADGAILAVGCGVYFVLAVLALWGGGGGLTDPRTPAPMSGGQGGGSPNSYNCGALTDPHTAPPSGG